MVSMSGLTAPSDPVCERWDESVGDKAATLTASDLFILLVGASRLFVKNVYRYRFVRCWNICTGG